MSKYLTELSSANQFFILCKESRIENLRNLYGCFYIGPFNSGQSLTVANALRRTLLSELQGLAINKVKIDGAAHEYSNLSGVKDSVLDILLNLKEIVLKSNVSLKKPQIGYVQAKGPGIIRAGDLKLPSFIQCVDSSQYIATLCEDGVLNMKFEIDQGINYSLNNSHKTPTNLLSQKKNLLLVDTVFMPVSKVNYVIESHKQVEQQSNSNIVILEVWTNGSIHPRQAVYEAFKILIRLFSKLEKVKIFNSIFLNSIFKSNNIYNKMIKKIHYNSNNDYNLNYLNRTSSNGKVDIYPFQKQKYIFKNTKKKIIINKLKQLNGIDIGSLNLSLGSYTRLKRAKINTVFDLIQYTREELLEFKKFGKRSLEEVENSLQEIGIHLKRNKNEG